MCSTSINEDPDRKSGRDLFFVGGGVLEWNGTRSVFSWTVIRLNEGGGGIWFQLSANPISHFIDLRGYCDVHAEKIKDVLFP